LCCLVFVSFSENKLIKAQSEFRSEGQSRNFDEISSLEEK